MMLSRADALLSFSEATGILGESVVVFTFKRSLTIAQIMDAVQVR